MRWISILDKQMVSRADADAHEESASAPPPRPLRTCIVCFEDRRHGLLCSKQSHFLCADPDCLLVHAEKAKTQTNIRTNFLRGGSATACVPCVANTAAPPSCWYEISDFTQCLESVSLAKHSFAIGLQRCPTIDRRVRTIREVYRSCGGGSSRGSSSAVADTSGTSIPPDERVKHTFCGKEEGDFDGYVHAILQQLSLKCPSPGCRKVLDPNPTGCAKMT